MISNENKCLINGLVLSGGKSIRMGRDKAMTPWHGSPQVYHMANLLKMHCASVFISCRADQAEHLDRSYKIITDKYIDAGPMCGILSAFEHTPSAAWLVVACDLPLIDEATIGHLIRQRNAEVMATAYRSGTDGLPEPLIAIWEPSSYQVLLNRLNEGFKCPRKVLINNSIHLIEAANAKLLMNVNTPAEAELAASMIEEQKLTR